MMTFPEACMEAAKMAKDEGKKVFLYRNREGWFASKVFWNDWLFKAYPGGRKVLSVEGTKLLRSTDTAEHRLHTDESGLAPTQAEYHKSVLSTPGSEPF